MKERGGARERQRGCVYGTEREREDWEDLAGVIRVSQ